MAGYDLDVTFDPKLTGEAIEFIRFLWRVGRKYPVQVRYRTLGVGKFRLIIDGTPGGRIDALLQELILSRGLYYYVCSLRSSSRQNIVRAVIVPIYQAMMSLSDAGISPQQFLKDRGWWKEEDLGN